MPSPSRAPAGAHPQDPLERLGWRPALAAALAALDDPALVPARVAGADRARAALLGPPGTPPYATVAGRLRHTAGTAADLPVVGDWVAVDPVGAVIRAVLPRHGGIARATASGRSEPHPLAANVDVALVAGALDRDHNLRRLERFVALAGDAGAEPVVLLTKADLAPDAGAVVAEVRAALGGTLSVLAVSVHDGRGLDALAGLLAPGRTAVLLGSSGVGKTTLRNHLAGGPPRPTAPVRPGDDRGRHTTTRRELVVLPGGALLIDTPGLRLPRLWDQGSGLATAFGDLEALAARCRFADCRHDGEPGCAVTAAIDAGRLTPERLDAHRRLERETARLAARRDERARSERARDERTRFREHRRVQTDARRRKGGD